MPAGQNQFGEEIKLTGETKPAVMSMIALVWLLIFSVFLVWMWRRGERRKLVNNSPDNGTQD
jgi:hypothetical protein